MVLFLVGLIDDLKEVSANKKLIFQLLIATLTVLGGTRLVSFHGFMGIGELPLFFQYSLSILIIVGLINAYNLIDGMDGLAAGIGLINSLAFFTIFILKAEMFLATLSLSFGGSLLAFLFFNFNPAKIFMGDTGSLIIGFMMAVFAFNVLSPGPEGLISYMEPQHLMVVVFAILMLPVFDSLRVYYQRIRKGGSPFQADQTHIHHLLHLSGLKVKMAVAVIYLANFVFIGFSFLIRPLNMELGVLMLIALSVGSYKAFTILFKPFERDPNEIRSKLTLTSEIKSDEQMENGRKNEKTLMENVVQ
ncbi:undecaprenyl/decaprenyl-phosphate alpha-N-acetylglucosaminyl 1-phosphate transferase [Cytophagales bacterium RKSG123]|nr:undecaprenyl/decaprenyl-phosphate alpha-N-acetylglucosaminyl 1-phosphate transferase [Xanthovirga aplysinae]